MVGEQSSDISPRGWAALRVAKYVVLIGSFLCLNSSLNMINKWALGFSGFRFPFLLTSCHMAFSFTVLAPVAMLQPWANHVATLQKQWRGIVYIGSFMALNIALNNLSLLDISLSLSQIIRSAIPVVACILAVLVEHKYPTNWEAGSLAILCLGVMLAVWQGTVTGKPYAILFSISATVSNGLMMTFSSKLMSEKLDVMRLTFYMSPVSLACLVPFFWVFERERFFLEYWPVNGKNATFIMLVSSINAVLYNLSHQAMIKNVTAVATTVIGEIKIIVLLVLSAMLLGESSEFTARMTVGCILALAGFGAYSYCKLSAVQKGASDTTNRGPSPGEEEMEPLVKVST